MTTILQHNLKQLDFEFENEFESTEPSLLFTNQKYSLDKISFGSRLILENARRLSATAVYLRYSKTNPAPQPQVFIYDNTSQQFSDSQLAEIHRRIWSSDIVSVYYVVERTKVKVFDARKSVDFDGDRIVVKPFETLDLVAEAQEAYKKYSAKLFENGSFWEQPEHLNNFLHSKGSSKTLIDELKKFRNEFVKQNKDSRELIQKLLVQSILVKYLEERRDEYGNGVFETGYFAQFGDAEDFCDVIRNGEIVTFLNSLSNHFNGKIFELTPDEIAELSTLNLDQLAKFLDAKSVNGQLSFWRLYAFDYVPVEVISRIYEEFISERADAVYTPTHLAQLMVDESMPLETPQRNFRAIDVSCGSGIFLVLVFKRLVQWWQKQVYEKTGEIKRPEIDTLQSILQESIYGVDIEEGSVQLTMFSLSLALCDMLSPTEIWLNLRFGNLEETNLIHIDFFEFLRTQGDSEFDLVIGNPPFKGSSDEVAQMIEKHDLDLEIDIPQKQIALLFLHQAMQLLRSGGLLCLVVPAGPLLYNKSLEFREHFFSKYEVPQIIDLSTLFRKGHLFESEVATAVIFARNQTPKSDHSILHVAVKRTKAARDKRFFEIDHYDLHYVPLEIAISDSIVWKTNLFGGGILYYLVERLLNSRSLGDFLEKKIISSKHQKGSEKWVVGEGYQIGHKNRTHAAPHLTGKKAIEADDFTEEGILKISVETEKKFRVPKHGDQILIFKPPHLLIKEVLGVRRFVTAYLEEYFVFKHRIIGIHAPWSDVAELRKIEAYLQKNYSLLKMLLLSFSSEAGIGRSYSALLKDDFMSLPYPEDDLILELSNNEKIIVQDVLQYGLDLLKQGERAEASVAQPSAEQLAEFGSVFCQNLNAIYQSNSNAFRPLEPIEQTAFICYPFFYGSDTGPDIHSPTVYGLNTLLHEKRRAVEFRRVVHLYQNDIVYLIKPKSLKYWLKSVALRDATDVMQDLIASGY